MATKVSDMFGLNILFAYSGFFLEFSVFFLLTSYLLVKNSSDIVLLQGYYSFSQKLKFIVRIPFAITAYGMYLCV